MWSGGSRAAKRIYYLGWQGVLSQCVSAVSHLALSLRRLEQSLLGATRERLSSLILALAISNVIDVLSYGESTRETRRVSGVGVGSALQLKWRAYALERNAIKNSNFS